MNGLDENQIVLLNKIKEIFTHSKPEWRHLASTDGKINYYTEKVWDLILEEKSKQRKEIIDNVMSLIDGHYDNPNLAGNLEDFFGITFQEWEKQD